MKKQKLEITQQDGYIAVSRKGEVEHTLNT